MRHSEVIFDIDSQYWTYGQTEPVLLNNVQQQGFHMVWVLQYWAQNSWTCDAQKIGIRDFGPFSETYHAEIFWEGGTEKRMIKRYVS